MFLFLICYCPWCWRLYNIHYTDVFLPVPYYCLLTRKSCLSHKDVQKLRLKKKKKKKKRKKKKKKKKIRKDVEVLITTDLGNGLMDTGGFVIPSMHAYEYA